MHSHGSSLWSAAAALQSALGLCPSEHREFAGTAGAAVGAMAASPGAMAATEGAAAAACGAAAI